LVVYDTYAWVEYFRGSEKGENVRKYLEKGGYTPSIVLAEIARKYLREGFPFEEVGKRLELIEAKTLITDIDVEIALESGRSFLELQEYAKKEGLRKPSLADALIYSTAKILKDNLITGDRLFKKLLSVIYIGD